MKKKLAVLMGVGLLVVTNGYAEYDMDHGEGSRMHHQKMARPKLAFKGFCSVCVAGGKLVKGKRAWTTKYNDALYQFPNFEVQKKFINNPNAYAGKANHAKFKALLMESHNMAKTKGHDYAEGSQSHKRQEGSHQEGSHY